MSKTEKIPVTKLSGLLFAISLVLIVSPAFLLLIGSRLFPTMVPSQMQLISLIPFVAGIALYLFLRFKRLL